MFNSFKLKWPTRTMRRGIRRYVEYSKAIFLSGCIECSANKIGLKRIFLDDSPMLTKNIRSFRLFNCAVLLFSCQAFCLLLIALFLHRPRRQNKQTSEQQTRSASSFWAAALLVNLLVRHRYYINEQILLGASMWRDSSSSQSETYLWEISAVFICPGFRTVMPGDYALSVPKSI